MSKAYSALLKRFTIRLKRLEKFLAAFCGQILCDSKEFLGKFSLINGVSNDTKRKEIKKTTIGIS